MIVFITYIYSQQIAHFLFLPWHKDEFFPYKVSVIKFILTFKKATVVYIYIQDCAGVIAFARVNGMAEPTEGCYYSRSNATTAEKCGRNC